MVMIVCKLVSGNDRKVSKVRVRVIPVSGIPVSKPPPDICISHTGKYGDCMTAFLGG